MGTSRLLFVSLAAAALAACSGAGSVVFLGADGGPQAGTSGDGGWAGDAAAGAASPDLPDTSAGLSLVVSKPLRSDLLLVFPAMQPSAGFPKAGNVFIALTVQINNVDNPTPAATGSTHFSLRTSAGVTYDPWLETDLIANNCAGHGSVAQGGSSQPCALAFELPASATPTSLVYAYSSAETGHASGPVPPVTAGPAGFCDRVSHSEGVVSSTCNACVQAHCPTGEFSANDLPPGTCPTQPFCICEREAYAQQQKGSLYEDFEGCVDHNCAVECIPK